MNKIVSIVALLLVCCVAVFLLLQPKTEKQFQENNNQVQNETNSQDTVVVVENRDATSSEVAGAEATTTDVTENTTSTNTPVEPEQQAAIEQDIQVAMFANGCFWCVESDLQKVSGVVSVVSGYADGSNANPTYKNYGRNDHREVVEVTYDAAIVSYGNLVEHILKHGDVTDPDGSFGDRGPEYAPAIYYTDNQEKQTALDVIAAASASGVYDSIITIEVIPQTMFWKAEEYHQDYAEKNPLKYFYYRTASGRTSFIEKYWGERATQFEFS